MFSSVIASASFILVNSLTKGIIKKILQIKNRKKKHNKIVVSAKIKLNNIEALMSHALIDLETSHKEFLTIVKEKEQYEKMKEDIRTMN